MARKARSKPDQAIASSSVQEEGPDEAATTTTDMGDEAPSSHEVTGAPCVSLTLSVDQELVADNVIADTVHGSALLVSRDASPAQEADERLETDDGDEGSESECSWEPYPPPVEIDGILTYVHHENHHATITDLTPIEDCYHLNDPECYLYDLPRYPHWHGDEEAFEAPHYVRSVNWDGWHRTPLSGDREYLQSDMDEQLKYLYFQEALVEQSIMGHLLSNHYEESDAHTIRLMYRIKRWRVQKLHILGYHRLMRSFAMDAIDMLWYRSTRRNVSSQPRISSSALVALPLPLAPAPTSPTTAYAAPSTSQPAQPVQPVFPVRSDGSQVEDSISQRRSNPQGPPRPERFVHSFLNPQPFVRDSTGFSDEEYSQQGERNMFGLVDDDDEKATPEDRVDMELGMRNVDEESRNERRFKVRRKSFVPSTERETRSQYQASYANNHRLTRSHVSSGPDIASSVAQLASSKVISSSRDSLAPVAPSLPIDLTISTSTEPPSRRIVNGVLPRVSRAPAPAREQQSSKRSSAARATHAATPAGNPDDDDDESDSSTDEEKEARTAQAKPKKPKLVVPISDSKRQQDEHDDSSDSDDPYPSGARVSHGHRGARGSESIYYMATQPDMTQHKLQLRGLSSEEITEFYEHLELLMRTYYGFRIHYANQIKEDIVSRLLVFIRQKPVSQLTTPIGLRLSTITTVEHFRLADRKCIRTILRYYDCPTSLRDFEERFKRACVWKTKSKPRESYRDTYRDFVADLSVSNIKTQSCFTRWYTASEELGRSSYCPLVTNKLGGNVGLIKLWLDAVPECWKPIVADLMAEKQRLDPDYIQSLS
jgi:hypothetical protein